MANQQKKRKVSGKKIPRKKSGTKKSSSGRKKIVDKYTEKLIKDLREYKKKERKGLISATERKNIKRREKSAVSRMIKAASGLIEEANSALKKLVDIGAITFGVERVLTDYGNKFQLTEDMEFSDIFKQVQGASTFLSDPETAYLTAQRITRNTELKDRYDELYNKLKNNTWKDNEVLSPEDMSRVFSNYRRIEEEKYSLISQAQGKEVYGSENLILFMIEVRRQGGDELLAAHDMLEEFEMENLPEYKALVEMRTKRAKSISGLFSDRGIYGRLGKLL